MQCECMAPFRQMQTSFRAECTVMLADVLSDHSDSVERERERESERERERERVRGRHHRIFN